MRRSYGKLVRKRTDTILLLFALAFVGLALRLTYLQAVRPGKYAALAKKIRSSTVVIPAERGLILDRCGRTLAANVKASSVGVRPARIQSKQEAAELLGRELGKGAGRWLEAMNSSKKFVWLARNVEPRVGLAVKDAVKRGEMKGIEVQEQTRRIYPCDETACHVIGFTDIDGKGLEGIEKSANSLLRGTDGYVLAELDAARRIIPQTRGRYVKPVNGQDMVLAIDANIQHIAEEELAKSARDCRAAGGSVVVLDPRTGEVLAMANYPTYDPNNRSTFEADCRRNRAVTDMYEPGSTLKIITAAAALEEGMKPSTTFHCPGFLNVGKRRIKCVVHAPFTHGHGAVDIPTIIRYSCNVGAAQIGMRLGADKLYEYEKKFGFGRNPGSGATGEMPGYLARPYTWPAVQLANVSFGQGIAVTPLQMACAYSVIASGGVYHQPKLIREIRTKEGKIVQRYSGATKGKRIITRETAAAIANMMTAVVEDGTGKAAKIEGIPVAGKTGTAQKAPYGCGKCVGSFGGFLPADNPRLVIFVTIDEPQGSHYGGVVAAPVFREIARRVIWYLRVPRRTPGETNVARMAADHGELRPAVDGHGWRLGPAHVRREGNLGRVPSQYSTSAPT